MSDRLAAHLAQRRSRPRDHRHAARHRFDHRQPEAFVHRRVHEHLGERVQRRQVFEGHVPGEGDRAIESASRDPLTNPARHPAVRADTHELVREIAGLQPLREGIDQRRQVLARLDRADVQDHPLLEAVLPPDPRERVRIAHRRERRRRGFVDDADAPRIHVVGADDVFLRAFGHGDDGVGAPRREPDQRPVEQHAARRVIPRIEPQAHIVNRDHRGHARQHGDHAVGEVRDLRVYRLQRRGRVQLNPHHARHVARRSDDAHVRRQRSIRIHCLIRQHRQLAGAGLSGEVMQQVLGVVADAGSSGTQRRAVKCDAHPRRSPRRARTPRPVRGSARRARRSARTRGTNRPTRGAPSR